MFFALISHVTEFGWSTPGKLYQYQLEGNNTGAEILASQNNILTGSTNYYFASLQLAPDEKIYMASSLPVAHVGRNGLSVINDPDSVGMLSNPVEDQITYTGGALSRSGLPNLPAFQVLNIPTYSCSSRTVLGILILFLNPLQYIEVSVKFVHGVSFPSLSSPINFLFSNSSNPGFVLPVPNVGSNSFWVW